MSSFSSMFLLSVYEEYSVKYMYVCWKLMFNYYIHIILLCSSMSNRILNKFIHLFSVLQKQAKGIMEFSKADLLRLLGLLEAELQARDLVINSLKVGGALISQYGLLEVWMNVWELCPWM